MKRRISIAAGFFCVAALLSFSLLDRPLAAKGAVSPFDGERALRDVEAIVAIGSRVSGSEGSVKAQSYIEEQVGLAGLRLDKYGFTAYTPFGERNMTNLVAVSEGTRSGVIILSGHYDTKYLPYIEFVGANDAGSSTAFLVEMARALGPKRDGYTIWLCWFDGEEAFDEWSRADSLYGSRAMVRRLRERGELDRVQAMINVDMIGDCALNVLRDSKAPDWMREAVWNASSELGYGTNFSGIARSMEDDHLPFREAGVSAMNLIDFEYGGNGFEHKANWHTARDTLDKVCAESLQIVGDVLCRALPALEAHLAAAEGSGADGP